LPDHVDAQVQAFATSHRGVIVILDELPVDYMAIRVTRTAHELAGFASAAGIEPILAPIRILARRPVDGCRLPAQLQPGQAQGQHLLSNAFGAVKDVCMWQVGGAQCSLQRMLGRHLMANIEDGHALSLSRHRPGLKSAMAKEKDSNEQTLMCRE
jgi:hypothetical protein